MAGGIWQPLGNSQGFVLFLDKEKTKQELFIIIQSSQEDERLYKNSSCIIELCFPMGDAAVGDANFTNVFREVLLIWTF